MESIADRESYWMLTEAAIWIRTRDFNQVLGIDDPIKSLVSAAESKQALEELPERCRNGYVRSLGRRCTYYDSKFKRAEPIGTSFLWRRRAEGAPSDVTERIPPHEWPDLEWEPPVDGKLTGNLRSRLLREPAPGSGTNTPFFQRQQNALGERARVTSMPANSAPTRWSASFEPFSAKHHAGREIDYNPFG